MTVDVGNVLEQGQQLSKIVLKYKSVHSLYNVFDLPRHGFGLGSRSQAAAGASTTFPSFRTATKRDQTAANQDCTATIRDQTAANRDRTATNLDRAVANPASLRLKESTKFLYKVRSFSWLSLAKACNYPCQNTTLKGGRGLQEKV